MTIRRVPNEEIPIIGPWLGRVGQVRAMMATPCQIEPEVWVLAGFTGVPRLIWSLFKPDAFDLVTERFQRGHKKKRKRRFKFGGMVIDPDAVPNKKRLTWAIFKLGSIAETAGWWMLIIDASTELAVHWTSTAYIYSGCPVPQGSFAKTAANDVVGGPVGGTFIFSGWGSVHSDPPLENDLSGINVPANIIGSPMMDIEYEEPGGGLPLATEVKLELVDILTGTAYAENDPSDPSGGRKFRSVWMNPGLINPARKWGLRVTYTGGWMKIKGILQLNAQPVQGIDFDP